MPALLLLLSLACAHRADLSAAPVSLTRACWIWELDRVEQEWRDQVAATLGVPASRISIRSRCGYWCQVTATVQAP